MGKDPAMLWYPSDWISGTQGMSFEEKGAYMELLMLQFNRGHMTNKMIINTIGDIWDSISLKFEQDDDGLWYHHRIDFEKEKRKKYVDSRKKSSEKSLSDESRIYLIRDVISGNIKIGVSVDPIRRYRELLGQQKPAVLINNEIRDYEMIFISKLLLREVGIELHDKYSSKRIKGEWFSLDNNDIETICSEYYETDIHVRKAYEERTLSVRKEYALPYVKRTHGRTENENIYINISNIYTKDKYKDIFNNHVFTDSIKNTIINWLEYKRERKESYRPRGLTALLTQIQNRINELGEESVEQVIQESMACNYKGIIWDMARNISTGGGNKKQERKYFDFVGDDEL